MLKAKEPSPFFHLVILSLILTCMRVNVQPLWTYIFWLAVLEILRDVEDYIIDSQWQFPHFKTHLEMNLFLHFLVELRFELMLAQIVCFPNSWVLK